MSREVKPHLKKINIGCRLSLWVYEEMKRLKIPFGPEFEKVIIEKYNLKVPKKYKKA